MVREALETSVTWTCPLVSFHISQESTVPNASSPFSAFFRAPEILSSIHFNLLAEKYASITNPVFSFMNSFRLAAFSSSQNVAVLLSCQTMALQTGLQCHCLAGQENRYI